MRRLYPPAAGGTARARGAWAFTLLELLVVIGIIGLLAATSVPAIRSLTQSNTVAAGSRQVLDDLSFARQLALSRRQTVYMVFVPPGILAHTNDILNASLTVLPQRDRQSQYAMLTNSLRQSQYSGYALFARRSVGDQPGRSTPAYLTPWKQLPEGMFFETNKFVDLGNAWINIVNAKAVAGRTYDTNRPLPYAEFPFPAANSPPWRLPYIAFGSRGQMYYEGVGNLLAPDANLTVARGSILYPVVNGQFLPPDVVETPKGNRMDVRMDWITGRAKVQQVELK